MERQCVICKQPFARAKTNKKTCSDKCRQQLARYRNQVKDKYWQMLADVETYEKMIEIDELHDIAHGKLHSIMVSIHNILERQQ